MNKSPQKLNYINVNELKVGLQGYSVIFKIIEKIDEPADSEPVYLCGDNTGTCEV
jgi:hypothetical protein